jgi:hypothetical protein
MSGYLEVLGVDAGEDMNTGSINDGSGHQYKAVTIDGTIAQAGENPVGILQNKPKSGEDASLGFMGRSRFSAGGGTIAAGADLTVANSGYMVTAGSGDAVFGRNISSIASGGIGEGIFNFVGGVKTIA